MEEELAPLRAELAAAHAALRRRMNPVSGLSLRAGRLRAVHEQDFETLEARIAEREGERLALKERIAPEDLRSALGRLQSLAAKEIAHWVQHLIERIDFDGRTQQITVTFSPKGIRALCERASREPSGRVP